MVAAAAQVGLNQKRITLLCVDEDDKDINNNVWTWYEGEVINVVAERDEFLETELLWDGNVKSLHNLEKKK